MNPSATVVVPRSRGAVALGLAGCCWPLVSWPPCTRSQCRRSWPPTSGPIPATGCSSPRAGCPTLTTPAPLLLAPGVGPRTYTANHPPLYYALIGVPLRLGLASGHPMAGLVAARLLTVLVGAAGVAPL